jgi:hypothetical protein
MASMDSMSNQNRCPKCQASLPEGAYAHHDTICPKCGLVFAKYRAAQQRAVRNTVFHHNTDNEAYETTLSELLLSVPDSISSLRFYAGVTGWLLFVIWGWRIAQLDYRTGEINQSFLHGPLLIFHEAGHVIFRLLGHFMTILGGTLGQLLMPLVILVSLLRTNHDTLGASLALWLLGVSLLDVAPYVYDALLPRLVLLNGATGEEGGHDWIYLLNQLGLIKQAHLLGGIVYWFGMTTITVAAVWSALLLTRQRHHITHRE